MSIGSARVTPDRVTRWPVLMSASTHCSEYKAEKDPSPSHELISLRISSLTYKPYMTYDGLWDFVERPHYYRRHVFINTFFFVTS